MTLVIFDKLRQLIMPYSNQDFLDAASATFVFCSIADGHVAPDEIHSFERLVLDDPALRDLSTKQAKQTIKATMDNLEDDPEGTKTVLSDKIRRTARDPEKAQVLLRIAHTVIVSDREIDPREREAFARLCGLLNIDPDEAWQALAIRFLIWDDPSDALLAKAPAGGTARIVNESIDSKWRVFETLDDAKVAAEALYKNAIAHHEKHGQAQEQSVIERRLAELPGLTAGQIPEA